MIKLGVTSSLGASLGFAAFQASVQQNALAVIEVQHAKGFLDRLTQNGVRIDPQGQIGSRLQTIIDTGTARQDIIESIRDSDLVQSYTNLRVPVLLHAYQLGVAIGGAEGQATTNNDGARPIIQNDANTAANFADNLSNDTPLQVPLNLSDISGSLRTIANQALGTAFSDLHNSLLFVRGESQGILDVTGPENF